jgi:hypothetical protein
MGRVRAGQLDGYGYSRPIYNPSGGPVQQADLFVAVSSLPAWRQRGFVLSSLRSFNNAPGRCEAHPHPLSVCSVPPPLRSGQFFVDEALRFLDNVSVTTLRWFADSQNGTAKWHLIDFRS